MQVILLEKAKDLNIRNNLPIMMLTEKVNDLAESYLAPSSFGLVSLYIIPTAIRLREELYARALHRDRVEALTQVAVLTPISTEGRLEGFMKRVKKDVNYRYVSTFEFFEAVNARRTWLLYERSQTLGSALTFGLISYGLANAFQHQDAKVLWATAIAIILGNTASYVYERIKGNHSRLRKDIPIEQTSSTL